MQEKCNYHVFWPSFITEKKSNEAIMWNREKAKQRTNNDKPSCQTEKKKKNTTKNRAIMLNREKATRPSCQTERKKQGHHAK